MGVQTGLKLILGLWNVDAMVGAVGGGVDHLEYVSIGPRLSDHVTTIIVCDATRVVCPLPVCTMWTCTVIIVMDLYGHRYDVGAQS